MASKKEEVSMEKCWQNLPPMIINMIIEEWEINQMLEDIFRENRRIEHRCERALYPVSKEVKEAWGGGQVFKTACGTYYGGRYFTHDKGNEQRLAVFYLGKDEKDSLVTIEGSRKKSIMVLKDVTGIWYNTSSFRFRL